VKAAPPQIQGRRGGMEIAFRPDPYIYDGRFANNAWLQELPRPMSKITWDNAAYIAPATAQKLGLQNEGVVELRFQGRSVTAPVWIAPGQAPDSITVHYGFGRTRAGKVGNGAGFNAYTLRTSNAMWHGAGVEIRKTGRKYRLATTQNHHSMQGRHLAISGEVAEYQKNPRFARDLAKEPPTHLTLYPEWKYTGAAWGMAIDLTACVNCNACVVACQSENNIPVVGKEQVGIGREMHWLRVDTYFKGSPDDPSAVYQPVPCMHCETAPCELVCPVQATAHSSEGLNDMVYNRCVGTRYCSNNCPYKVRRFNFFRFADWDTPSLKAMYNPDVTVRSRGVMEKCTYCVQRIREAQITAKRDDRGVRDGEIQTACQQVCPAQAIIFGDINDKNSRVANLRAEPLNYSMLAELNTRPRTTYLAELRNPNPEMGEYSRPDLPADLRQERS
jgi:Fe-S-cluster-containing dehydrogenase component